MAKARSFPVFSMNMEQYQQTVVLIINTTNGSVGNELLMSRIQNVESLFPEISTHLKLIHTAYEYLQNFKRLAYLDWDADKLQQFTIHNEILSRAQGSLATMLLVGEHFKPTKIVARVQEKKPNLPVSKKSRRKKTGKI
jgi:hypothetical protein